MKDEFRKMWGGFVNWLKYVREYKDNKDYCEIKEAEVVNAYREMEKLKEKIKELEDAKAVIEKERDQANNTILTMQNSNIGKEEKSDSRLRLLRKRKWMR